MMILGEYIYLLLTELLFRRFVFIESVTSGVVAVLTSFPRDGQVCSAKVLGFNSRHSTGGFSNREA